MDRIEVIEEKIRLIETMIENIIEYLKIKDEEPKKEKWEMKQYKKV